MSQLHFDSLLAPSATPKIFPRRLGGANAFLKDTFSTFTLLVLGATIQSALVLVAPVRTALLPAFLLLLSKTVTTALQASGALANPYMADVLPGRATAQIPSGNGTGARTALEAESVTVVFLGMQVNHPLGLFAPGVQEVGRYLKAMEAEMRERAEEFRLLGASAWRADQHRETANEILLIFYFRDVEGVHKFSQGPAHRAGWDWYNKAGLKHIGFMHEVFSVPRSMYESVYLNCSPHLLGGTSAMRDQDEEGNALKARQWLNFLVAADKSTMRNSFGRLRKNLANMQSQGR